MDILKHAFSVVKGNIKLALLLAALAVTGGITHYFNQTIVYSSNFKTNNGFVDYALFKSLTDFTSVNSDIYDLPEPRLKEIIEQLDKFTISYVEETVTSFSFTVTSKIKDMDHTAIQNDILELINNNRFIKNAQFADVSKMKLKLTFLEQKIEQLDSLMMTPSVNTRISEIPSDSYYLYSEWLDIQEKMTATGQFSIIKPVTTITTNKKPLVLFVALYLILFGFIFMVFSKKVQKAS